MLWAAMIPKTEAETVPLITPVATSTTIYASVYGYSSDVSQTDDTPFITASGQHVRDGIVANNCLPFGTSVIIGGRTYTVEDRMNRRYGCSFFDVWVRTAQDARTLRTSVVVLSKS